MLAVWNLTEMSRSDKTGDWNMETSYSCLFCFLLSQQMSDLWLVESTKTRQVTVEINVFPTGAQLFLLMDGFVCV